MTETAIEKRHTVESLFAWKLEMLREFSTLTGTNSRIMHAFEALGDHSPYSLNARDLPFSDDRESRYIDKAIWRFIVRQYHLEKYMLCTDWERMRKEIEEFRTPEFTVENANAWIAGLKDLIYDNVRTLVKKVYREIIDGTYYVGSGYNAKKKKRNNNGIDRSFILHTGDYSTVYGYWSSKPTITDDLEKACYLLDGKTLPDVTLKAKLSGEHSRVAENEYMAIEICKNGNTHYRLEDGIREKLNRFGPDGAVIGENIKIKVFERVW